MQGLIASTLATLATAPLVAWNFGRVSLIGPITNLLAAPLVALLQPTLFLALLLAPWQALGALAADAAHPLLVLLDGLATAGAGVPYASLPVAPTLAAAWLGAAAAVGVLLAAAGPAVGPALVAAGGALALLVWLPLLPTGSGRAELHMLDVGQGDAIALRSPGGAWLLVDAGRVWRGGDAGRRVVIPHMRRRGGPLAALVLSHPHADHVGGAPSVLRALRPRQLWDVGFAGESDAYRATLAAAESLGVEWRRVRPGEEIRLDSLELRFLAPDSVWTAALTDPNLASAVALVRVGTVRFLLVGDAERAEEAWLLGRAPDHLRADVLKVGHHGSATSSSPAFLAAVRPRIALVSVGAGNSYGHPDPGVLRALARSGALVLRTDELGSVVVRTDGRTIEVIADGEAWEFSTASAPR